MRSAEPIRGRSGRRSSREAAAAVRARRGDQLRTFASESPAARWRAATGSIVARRSRATSLTDARVQPSPNSIFQPAFQLDRSNQRTFDVTDKFIVYPTQRLTHGNELRLYSVFYSILQVRRRDNM